MKTRKIRMGMVGGGKDAFIGAVHRIAANIDGQIELCCGALSINPEIAIASGEMLFLPEDRVYLTFEDMIEKESQMPADKRIDFVTILFPDRYPFFILSIKFQLNIINGIRHLAKPFSQPEKTKVNRIPCDFTSQVYGF